MARGAEARAPSADDEGLPLDGGRPGRHRARARQDPAAARVEPVTPRCRPRRPLPRARARRARSARRHDRVLRVAARRGADRSVGLSHYDADGIREALRHGAPALVQNSFSLLDRDDERDVIPLCDDNEIPYVPFGPLAGGWLTGKYRRGEAYPEGSRMTQRPDSYTRYDDGSVFDALEALAVEAASRGVDSATLAFAWVLARVDGAVCGPNREAHLDPILAARELRLTPDDVDTIGGLFEWK